MAIFDAKLEFSDDQDISQSAGTAAATNTFNFVNSDLEMGAGEPIWFNARIGTEKVSDNTDGTSGSSTLVLSLVNETDTTIDSSSVIVWTSKTFTEAELLEGAWVIRMALPNNVDDQKILGVLYTIAGATSLIGTIDAWLDHGPQSSYDTQVSESNI